jgi:GNAT superfamily N-acetyltransferase
MTDQDLAFADSLRDLAGWNQIHRDWLRLLRSEPEGCFIAEWNGAPAGTVTTTCYGERLGWIGMLLVHPDLRGRGLGSALLRRAVEHLESRNVRCIKLDATPLGQPLYQRLGFVVEWPLTRWETGLPTPGSPETSRHIHKYNSLDLLDLVALDAEAFGIDRSRLLAALLQDSIHAVCFRDSTNELFGFGMLRPGSRAWYLGPVTARSETAASEIIRHLVGLAGTGGGIFWDIPDGNAAASALAQSLGFRPQRPLVRMFRGENDCPGDPLVQFGIADPAVG